MTPEEKSQLHLVHKELSLGEHILVFGHGYSIPANRAAGIGRLIQFYVLTTAILIAMTLLYPTLAVTLPFVLCAWLVFPFLIFGKLHPGTGSPGLYALTNERLLFVDLDFDKIETIGESSSLGRIHFRGKKVTVQVGGTAFEILRIQT